jgi:hypothetical protein
MAPLLVSALVGIGVKIATDLVMSGAKQFFKGSSPAASFANVLDKARADTPVAPASASAVTAPGTSTAAADRARLLEAPATPGASRAQGLAAYQRLDEIPPQAI